MKYSNPWECKLRLNEPGLVEMKPKYSGKVHEVETNPWRSGIIIFTGHLSGVKGFALENIQKKISEVLLISSAHSSAIRALTDSESMVPSLIIHLSHIVSGKEMYTKKHGGSKSYNQNQYSVGSQEK